VVIDVVLRVNRLGDRMGEEQSTEVQSILLEESVRALLRRGRLPAKPVPTGPSPS